MPNIIFHQSAEFTLGAELELQLINPVNNELISRAKDLIRNIRDSEFNEQIKPEITQGMIELNSKIHTSPQSLYFDLMKVSRFLNIESEKLGVLICGGGTHPFQHWNVNKIFPSVRFKNLSRKHRYLSKQFTIFALHIHIGCKNGNDAIYLTEILSRYIPQLIALSASSPFYQGIDTGFDSVRLNIVNAFPTSGIMPFFLNWKEFSNYYLKLRKLGIVNSMKDIYWDIRPKPKFGTVEIRVCDAPLSIQTLVTIVAYTQALARFILLQKPYPLSQDLYTVYHYNRFQACRFGYKGIFIDPYTLKKHTLHDDILATIKLLRPHAKELDTLNYLNKIRAWVNYNYNDSHWIRNIAHKMPTLERVVQRQCQLWKEQF